MDIHNYGMVVQMMSQILISQHIVGFLLHEHTLFGNEAQHTLIVIVYKKAFGYFIHSGF